MPISDDVRKQIMLGINVDGADAPAKLAAEITYLKAAVKATSEEFATGSGSAQLFQKDITSLNGMIGKLQKLLDELTKSQNDATAAQIAATAAAKEEFIAEMGLADAIEKISTATAQQARDEQRMLVERKAMIEAMREGVVVAGYHAQAMLEEAIAGNKATASIKGVGTATDQAGKGTRLWNQAMIQAGYGIGDLMQTSGGLGQRLMSVTNNVQMATAGFGGWAIAGGVALTAIAALMTNVKDLDDVMVVFGQSVPKVTDELEHLEKAKKDLEKTTKLDIDRTALAGIKEEIDAINKGLQEFERLKDLRSSHEEESGKQVKQIIAEVPGGAAGLAARLEEDRKAKAIASSPTLSRLRTEIAQAEKDLAEAKATPDISGSGGDSGAGVFEALLNDLQEQGRTEISNIERQAGVDVGAATGGAFKGNTDAQRQLMAMLRGAGMGDLAAKVREVNPSAVKTKREQAEAKRLQKEKDDAQKAKDAEADRLNKQGDANRFAAQQAAIREQEAAERTQQHEINRRSTTLGHALGQDLTAGGLPAQIAKGLAGGGTDAAIQQQVAGLVGQRAAVAGIPPEMMGAVVQQVIEKAIEKVRAEAAGNADNVQAGAAQIAAEIAEKAARQTDAQARRPITRAARDKSDAAKAQQEAIAADIQAHTGFSPEMANLAAKDAINKMRHGMDGTQAAWSAVGELMEKFVMMQHEAAGNQVLFQQKLQQLDAKISGVGHSLKGTNRRGQRMNNARPSLIGWQN